MSVPPLLNAAGRRRSPVTLPGYLAGRPPRNKGLRYPPEPPTVEEIVAVMRRAGDGVHGARMRALIVLLWRAGLRINEALTLTEHDLDPRRRVGACPPRQGSRRREVGMDPWGWDHLRPWLEYRIAMPVGPLLCVIDGPTRGRRWASDSARGNCGASPPRRVCGGGSRRTSCATPTPSSSRTRASRSTSSSASWRHTNLGVTSIYLQGIDNAEIIATVHGRKAPMIPASTGPRI
jgi:integrase